MVSSFYELCWFCFIYSFIGWCGEVCVAAIHKKKFINRGFVSSPLCPIYGAGAVVRFNFEGYICLKYSILWGIFAILLIYFLNPLLASVVAILPGTFGRILLWILGGLLLLDALETKELLSRPSAREKTEVFGKGCSFYKLVSLFFIGAFLGDITETVFCLVTTGRLMSRSSVVYGPFSIVWGLGAAC